MIDSNSNSNFEIPPQLIETIDILEELERLMEMAPTPEVEQILQEAWLRVSNTFPEDFQAATHMDAGAEGLRLYLRVKSFFADPSKYPIRQLDLELYYQRHTEALDDDFDDDDDIDWFISD